MGKLHLKELKPADEIISRLHVAYGIEEKRGSLKVLGENLGVSGSVISGWRDRGVPDEKIARATIDTGFIEIWIKTGEGPTHKKAATNRDTSYVQQLDKREARLLDVFRQLDPGRKDRLMETAEDMLAVVLALEGKAKEEGGEDKQRKSKLKISDPDMGGFF